MPADIDIKDKWAAAHKRALRASQLRSKSPKVPKSPIAEALEVEVSTSITEGELIEKIKRREETHPGFMRASYKGCCLTEMTGGFPKFYKRVLGSLLNEAEKKSLRKQAKLKLMTQEVDNNEVIQEAIRVFNPTRVTTKAIRANQVRRRRRTYYGGNVHNDRSH